MTSKSSKVDFSEVLPDDEKIISRNLAWRQMLERFSEAASDKDDEGILIRDFVEHYSASNDIPSDESSASDVCEDDDSYSSSSEDDLEENKQQLAVAVKSRINQWKECGLEKIFEDNFTLGTKEAMNWLQHCKVGQGKAMERGHETRFTEIDGDKTLDVNCMRNVSFLNQNGAQKLTSINNSNIELKHGTGRRIIFQQTERTLTTIFDECTGSWTDLSLPSSMFSFSNLNVNNIPNILQGRMIQPASKPTPSRKKTFKPPKPPKKSNRNEPNDRVPHCIKIEMDKEIASKHVAQKKTKDTVIVSDSDDNKSESLSSKVTRKPRHQKRVTFKVIEQPEKHCQKPPNGRSKQCSESEINKGSSSKQLNNTQQQATKVITISSTDSESEEPSISGNARKPIDQKQTNALNPKPSTSWDGPQIQHTYKTHNSKQKNTEIKSKNPQTHVSSTESNNKSQEKPEEKAAQQRPSTKAKQQQLNERSDESGVKNKSEADAALCKPNVETERSSAKDNPLGKPQIAAPTDTKLNNDQQYNMPAELKQQLQVGGRVRYRLQGMVIYRPKQIKHDAPVTERIRISRENLDLGAIEDEKKRQKFNNFLYSIHPNSTIVYYMSEDEEEPEAANDAEDGSSEDEDDPILTFRPKVCVFEIPYEGPSV